EVTTEDFQRLDDRVQALIRKNFTALANVCLASMNMLKNLEKAMQHEVECALSERQAGIGVMDMLLAGNQNVKENTDPVADALASSFDGAAPELNGLLDPPQADPQAEFAILVGPCTSTDGQRTVPLDELAARAVSDQPLKVVENHEGPATHEIMSYREE